MAGSTTIVDKDGTALGTAASPFSIVQRDAAGNPIGGAKAAAISAGGFTAINAAASAPTTGTAGGNTGAFSNVLAVLTYSATTLTAARIRLWTRLTGANTAWIPGASSDDFGAPFTPSVDPMKTAQAEQRVFAIGAGVEFLFTLEAISPSGGATVACAVWGVS